MENITSTNTKNISTEDALRAQFKFSYEDTKTYIIGNNILEKELWTNSKKINIGETTMKDIYNCCNRDFQDFQREYIIEDVDGNPVIATTYILCVKQKDEPIIDDLDIYSHKRIYLIKLEGGIITYEYRYFERENETFKAPFEVYFKIGLQYHSDLEENERIEEPLDENEDERIEETDEETDEDIKRPIKQTLKEDKCCICLENAPNVLYCNCGHIPTCIDCENKDNLLKCPLCRTKVKADKRLL